MQQKEPKGRTAANRNENAGAGNMSACLLSAMGLNDNLDFMGRQLHVQTENMRTAGLRIVTQVFCNGRVLFSTRSEHPPEVFEPQNLERVQELMRAQHFRVIEKIRDKKSEILGAS